MDTPLTISSLSSINDNNISNLQDIGEATDLISAESFATKFSKILQEMVASDGKFKPLQFADLENLSSEQITDLAKQAGINLPAEFLSGLSRLASDKETENFSDQIIQGQDGSQTLNANPIASALLNLTAGVTQNGVTQNDELNADDLLEVTDFSNDGQKKGLALKEALSHPSEHKESILTKALNDFDKDLAKQLKNTENFDIDANTSTLSSPNKQDANVSKLVDQLSSIERPTSTGNVISHQSVQATSSQDTSASLRRIEVPVQQAGWGQAVGDKLMMMVNDKVQSAHIHLNPAELGPIEVRVNINHDQASVHFVSGHTAVRDAIEEAFPRLKEMFMQNGISLTDANVSQQSPQQGQQYSGQQNESAEFINNNFSEFTNTETEVTHTQTVGIGLINHYV